MQKHFKGFEVIFLAVVAIALIIGATVALRKQALSEVTLALQTDGVTDIQFELVYFSRSPHWLERDKNHVNFDFNGMKYGHPVHGFANYSIFDGAQFWYE